MSLLFTLLALLSPAPEDTEALRSTAPTYLTIETAREHLVAARVAADVYGVDADLLLSIAWFESRYTADVVGPVVKGKRACGVMQSIMKDGCPKNPTLSDGYLEGAKHLRDWLDASRNDLRTAILGYAGGYALIKACNKGKLMVERAGRQVDLCTVVDTRLYRMRLIQRARARAAS
jgi:soluble lytic murein transglycosylase-like protein